MSSILFDQNEVTYDRRFLVPELIMTYYIKIKKDEYDGFIVTCPELQGVVTSGETEEKAIKNAYDAVRTMLVARGLDYKFHLLVL